MESDGPLFDAARARQLRDEGTAASLTGEDEWKDRGLRAIEKLTPGWEGIGEDVRVIVRAAAGDPHSPKCWGSLVLAAIRRGLLAHTGRMQRMSAAKSHGRLSPLLMRPI